MKTTIFFLFAVLCFNTSAQTQQIDMQIQVAQMLSENQMPQLIIASGDVGLVEQIVESHEKLAKERKKSINRLALLIALRNGMIVFFLILGGGLILNKL